MPSRTMTSSFNEIPTIDLSQATDPATLPKLLIELRYALTDVGFLYVSNRGVPKSVVDGLVNALPKLFSLDDEVKKSVALEKSPHFLGYSGVGSENTGRKVDKREQYEFGTELTATWHDGLPLSERLRGPNQWPEFDGNFRSVVEEYINELSLLGERFLDLIAHALSLSPGTFQPSLSDQHRLKLVYYPEASTGDSENQGVGPHKDSSGWWTSLLQASPPEVKGLQVLNKAGYWVDVPVVPGTFVVNTGQAFEVVTNGVCKATTHRVLSGPHERYSVPFFQGMRRDLTKAEATGSLKAHFGALAAGKESDEASAVDSAFLKGKYDTWGESQLRTKVRSHRENGKKFYPEVHELYINDDA
ncbi:Uu.00g008460.m01.CDS01 [Anthostomella pinea]|uniref:Uu.00g008460.m01.CDS01 n=1 Tax=Anthostomella pinea TaxID=933095 RepID=A0AAI8VX59_9PEZI|nr:Uu.00g008460.m01.CDS01 [Anthostomella pinea]